MKNELEELEELEQKFQELRYKLVKVVPEEDITKFPDDYIEDVYQHSIDFEEYEITAILLKEKNRRKSLN